MKALSSILDNLGNEYTIEMTKHLNNSFTDALIMLTQSYGCAEQINKLEDNKVPIIGMLKTIYNMGYMNGAEFALNDHSNITRDGNEMKFDGFK